MASPFSVFRKNQKVMMAVIGILCMISFVFLGNLQRFGMGRGGSTDPEVATWKYGTIYQREVRQALNARHQVNQFLTLAYGQAAQANASPNYERFPESEAAVLDTIILAKKARQMDMVVSDAAINDYLKWITGKGLSTEQLQSLLNKMSSKDHAFTEAQLFDALEPELLARDLRIMYGFPPTGDLSSVRPDNAVTPAQRWDVYQRLNRKVSAEVLPVRVADYTPAVKDPTEPDLHTLYDEHKNDLPSVYSPTPGFKRPYRAKFQYFKTSVEDFAKSIDVSDKDIEDYYEKNKATQFKATKLPAADDSKPDSKPADDKTPSDKTSADKKDDKSDDKSGDKKPDATEPAKPGAANTDDKKSNEGTAKPDANKPAGKEPAKSNADAKPSTDAGAKPSTDAGAKPSTDTDAKPLSDKNKPADAGEKSSDGKSSAIPFSAESVAVLEQNLLISARSGELLAQAAPTNPPRPATKPAAARPAPAAPAKATTPPAKTNPDSASASKPDAADSKPATAPADPLATKPDSDKPATDKPASDKPDDKSTDKPASSKSSDSDTSSAAKPSTEGTDKAAGTDKPGADKAADKKPEADPLDVKPSDKKPDTTEYQPLEKVRDEIKRTIARQRAVDKLKETFDALQEKMAAYRSAEAELRGGVTTTKPEPLNFEALGREYHVTAVPETSFVSREEAYEQYDIGKSYQYVPDRNSQIGYSQNPFTSFAFSQGTQYLFQPMRSEDNDRSAYLSWKIDERKEEVPDFKSAHKEVLTAWKLLKARSLAVDEAKKFAETARKAKKTLKEAFADDLHHMVHETGPFTWLTRGTAPSYDFNAPLRMSKVENVDKAGEEFMRAVYDLQDGEIGVAMNQPQTIAYVVQVTMLSPSVESLRASFISHVGHDPYYRQSDITGLMDIQSTYIAWLRQIQDEMNVHAAINTLPTAEPVGEESDE